MEDVEICENGSDYFNDLGSHTSSFSKTFCTLTKNYTLSPAQDTVCHITVFLK